MSFCINYWSHREHQQSRSNLESADRCKVCGTPLVLQNRYRVLRNLRQVDKFAIVNYEVFEVEEVDTGKRKVLKTLVRSDKSELVKLFRREADVLFELARSEENCVPRGETTFEISLNDPDHPTLQCLIMEHIQGINLERWIGQRGKIRDLSIVLDWLDQLLYVLKLIHGKNVIHRDIKPSNIMWQEDDRHGKLVLIDFGSVKFGTSGTAEILANPTRQTTVNSIGYSPKEVQNGNPVQQSDFYSLGQTLIYLLTGQHPDQIDGRWERSIDESLRQPKLIDLIDDLVQETWQKRPRTVQEITDRLNAISGPEPPPPPVRSFFDRMQDVLRDRVRDLRVWLGLGGIATLATLVIVVPPLIEKIRTSQPKDTPTVSPTSLPSISKLPEGVSDGRTSLIDQSALPIGKYAGSKRNILERFNQATSQAAWKDIIRSIEQLLKDAENDRTAEGRNFLKDPEIWIALNNATVYARGQDIVTIAVPVPLNRAAGLHILQGVALAQHDLVQPDYKKDPQSSEKVMTNLRIVFANDENDLDIARTTAAKLSEIPEVLGIVGHFTSENTSAAMDTYKNSNLVVMNPTSTGTNLSKNYGGEKFFRTVSSTIVEAEGLVESVKQQNLQGKMRILSTGGEFSETLQEKFQQEIASVPRISLGWSLLSGQTFNPTSNEIQEAKTLVLFPDGQNRGSDTFARAKNIIRQYSNQDKKFLGAASLYLWDIFSISGENNDKEIVNRLYCKFFMAIDWLPKDGNPLVQKAGTLYGNKGINFRTALANDAVQALATVLKPNVRRSDQGIAEALKSSEFSGKLKQRKGIIATGGGTISFANNGDRQEIKQRTIITPAQQGEMFVDAKECPQK